MVIKKFELENTNFYDNTGYEKSGGFGIKRKNALFKGYLFQNAETAFLVGLLSNKTRSGKRGTQSLGYGYLQNNYLLYIILQQSSQCTSKVVLNPLSFHLDSAGLK